MADKISNGTLAIAALNSGGEGKTTIIEQLATLTTLAGLDTQVVDIDPGLRGYTQRKVAALRLSWSGLPDQKTIRSNGSARMLQANGSPLSTPART